MKHQKSSTEVAISCALAALLAVAGTSASASAQWVPPYYNIYRAGLVDDEHTAPDGIEHSTALGLNANGRVIGTSVRLENGYASFLGSAPVGQGLSAWTWSVGEGTTRLGFIDDEHTAADGTRASSPSFINDAGRIAGTSQRFAGNDDRGTSAWTWAPGMGLARVGFIDGDHTFADGYQSNFINGLNASGQIIGGSARSAGVIDPSMPGNSAWSWTLSSGITRLGFIDNEHTDVNGLQSSNASYLNDAGRVVGLSTRYIGAANAGSSAWTWTNAGGMTRVGIIDTDHTGADGTQNSLATFLTQSGQIVGFSDRYVGAEPGAPGRSVWSWTQNTGTARLGLFDADHTFSSGYQHSEVVTANAGGRVIGHSNNYVGVTNINTPSVSAWTWTTLDGTTRIGLIGAGYISNAGAQRSLARELNGNGRIIGESERYGAPTSITLGTAAWTWTAATGTIEIGLSGGAYTSTTYGVQNNTPLGIAESGRIVGQAARYNGDNLSGQAIWTWDDNSLGTVRIGLFDSQHTRTTTQLQQSDFIAMNDAGQIIGTSARYNNVGFPLGGVGQSGWFFDPATGLTTPLVFATGTAGRAFTTPTILTDGGVVLGVYNLYTGAAITSTNAFVWSLDNGFSDLGNLIDGTLSEAGWALLAGVVDAHEYQTILGHGKIAGFNTNDGQGVYILTTVPVPGSAVFVFAGAFILGVRHRAPVPCSGAR